MAKERKNKKYSWQTVVWSDWSSLSVSPSMVAKAKGTKGASLSITNHLQLWNEHMAYYFPPPGGVSACLRLTLSPITLTLSFTLDSSLSDQDTTTSLTS